MSAPTSTARSKAARVFSVTSAEAPRWAMTSTSIDLDRAEVDLAPAQRARHSAHPEAHLDAVGEHGRLGGRLHLEAAPQLRGQGTPHQAERLDLALAHGSGIEELERARDRSRVRLPRAR